MTKVLFILYLINACFLVSSSDAGITEQKYGRDISWDFLTLAQFWPGASCIYFEESGCLVPSEVKGWTIHGLWPSTDTQKEQPECCRNDMRFNYNQIKSLRKQLDVEWPYLNKTGDRLYLWTHEWNKHGTCAYDLPILQGELKYFTAALQLYSQLDIYGTLKQANIIPREGDTYNLDNIFNAIVNVYNKKPQIECFNSSGDYYLEQIYLCYDKTLSLIDCPEANVYNYGNSMNRRTCSEKPGISLHFASEKYEAVKKQKLDQGGYFIKCPQDGNVLYVPVHDKGGEDEFNEMIV